MKKETFIKSIEAIKLQWDNDKEKAQLLSKVFPENYEANMLYDNNIMKEAFIDLLTEQMNDNDGFIEYFIYELDFGKKGEKLAIIIDNKKICLKNSEDLYNFLTNKNN